MAGLDTNKISNILGTKIPQWLLKQLDYRSQQNTQDRRDNDNILFLANKTAWIRLVSSIDVVNPSDIRYFQNSIDECETQCRRRHNPQGVVEKATMAGVYSDTNLALGKNAQNVQKMFMDI